MAVFEHVSYAECIDGNGVRFMLKHRCDAISSADAAELAMGFFQDSVIYPARVEVISVFDESEEKMYKPDGPKRWLVKAYTP